MKHLFFVIAIAIAPSCKKPAPETATTGSGSAASTGSGSATAPMMMDSAVARGSAVGSATGSGDTTPPFDDKLEMPTQPKRSAADEKRFATAEAALRATLTTAKTATSGTTLCPAFAPLDKAMTALDDTSPPAGTQGYAELRSTLQQTFDGIGNFCASPGQDPKDAPMDELTGFLGNIRSRFIELAHLGAMNSIRTQFKELAHLGAASADVSRATTIMNAQIAAIQDKEAAALADTFSADAIVLVPDPRLAHAETTGLREAIARLSPHDTLHGIKIIKLVANANATAVWWSAELSITGEDHEPETPASAIDIVVRVTELATADAKWKVVAGAFAELAPAKASADASPIDAASTTDPGFLSTLPADLTKLDAALDPNVVVFGTDKGEAAYGAPSAHRLLNNWKKLAFTSDEKPRELHGKEWGYAIANINWQQAKKTFPARMSALVIATPVTDGWQVVAVQYTAN